MINIGVIGTNLITDGLIEVRKQIGVTYPADNY